MLLPIWAVCFGLSLRSLRDPPVIPLLNIRPGGAGDYPTLIRISRWIEPGETGLELGDRLVQVGSVDLRGVGPLGFFARFQVEAVYGKPVPLVYERDGRRAETVLPVRLRIPFAAPIPLGFAIAGVLLSLRAPPSPVVRAVSRAFLLAAISSSSLPTGGVTLNYAALALVAVSFSLSPPMSLRALLTFLRDGPPATVFSRFGPWLFALMGPISVSALTGFPLGAGIGGVLWQLCGLVSGVLTLALIAHAYRQSDAVRRRQIRWVVFGLYGATVPGATVTVLMLMDRLLFGELQRLYPLLWASGWFGILTPVCGFIAIVRYNLFDVDRLLSATASYNIVLVVLVGVGLVVVPRVGELSSQWLGLDPRMGQVALSLALAAIVVPAQQRLRPRIERVFFKERHALELGIAEVLRSLSACEDTRTLTRRVGEELSRLLRPEACVVYARTGEAFVPVFVEGRAVPLAFEAGSLLVATLAERRKPLALSAAGRTPDAAELGAFDRAALQTLEVEVVVPVRREALAAFLCLGPKRSGDVYTSTDLAHLAAVAEAVSSQLRRFDQEQVIHEARAMQESLRRYVPGAVADQLASGSELASGEREVSVLFVDLRGYTGFAEARRPEQVFSTVNRYTEAVSTIVRSHGGSVVEFNGDGMMAVFGAPRGLPEKERAAVAAGREIPSAVGALPVDDPKDAEARLSVGVGIATGEAFVGNIRAADRLIWSAIGNTTNLAARLQALTRELGTELVIDTATFRALGPGGRDFQHHPDIPIRGRSRVEDVYAWSARTASMESVSSGRLSAR